MLQSVIKALQMQEGITLLENAPMRDYSSFQVGGPADVLIQPESAEAFVAARRILREAGVPTTVIGAGSNLLVSDKGIRGAVIRLGKAFSKMTVSDNTITAEAGVMLARLANEALSASLAGLEFASGIPGTLGGAVFMNAGAYGGEMKDVVVETEYLDETGTLRTLRGADHGFVYRGSAFCGTENIILRSKLLLTPGSAEEIRAKMLDFNTRRKDKQPLSFPSAGSTFKRPEGYFAGKLIEDAGLKGFSVGGAQVSKKHAGFVINKSGATAEDIWGLIKEVRARVLDQFGVSLEPEVRMLGEFSE